MDVKIFRDKALAPDTCIGRIDDRGKVFKVEFGEDDYLGWIDYEEGDIYNAEDVIIGWVEDDGEILSYFEDEEEEIGFVTDEGELYLYSENAEEKYFGKVRDMQDFTEGAAALLFFFMEEE